MQPNTDRNLLLIDVFRWCESEGRRVLLAQQHRDTVKALADMLRFKVEFSEFCKLPGGYSEDKAHGIVLYYQGKMPTHPFAIPVSESGWTVRELTLLLNRLPDNHRFKDLDAVREYLLYESIK